jgi:hypothetical protein
VECKFSSVQQNIWVTKIITPSCSILFGVVMHSVFFTSNDVWLVSQERYTFHSLTEHPVLLWKPVFPVANQKTRSNNGRGWLTAGHLYVWGVKKKPSHYKNGLHLAVISSLEQVDCDVLHCFFSFHNDKINFDSSKISKFKTKGCFPSFNSGLRVTLCATLPLGPLHNSQNRVGGPDSMKQKQAGVWSMDFSPRAAT